MFNFDKVESVAKINKDFILRKLSDAQIFRYYFGQFDLATSYKSKFVKDNNPSTGFYVSKSGKLIYNHFNGKVPKMDAFAYVQALFNLDFKGTVNRIAYDFGLVPGNASPVDTKVMNDLVDFDREYKKETKISFLQEKWNNKNHKFWAEYHITIDELKREGVYPIKELFLNEKPIFNPNNFPRYALTLQHKGEMLTKVYSPNPEDKFKWINSIPLNVPFGTKNLNKDAPYSVTTKSVKDMIILKKFCPAVIASQNESRSAMSQNTMDNLFRLYPKNYIAWDVDDVGNDAMDVMEELDFIPIRWYEKYYEDKRVKDYSDLAKEEGLQAVEQVLKDNGVI